jgi:nucleotide-binding universal stress UspA family protein
MDAEAGPIGPGILMKTIVAAVDFSDVTGPVLEQAVALARAFGAELHLVHALPPGPDYGLYGFSPAEFPVAPPDERLRTASESRLAELAGGLGLPAGSVKTAVLLSTPVDGILSFCQEKKADLLVLGAHGHGFISALLMGSVAQGIVRRAELPTLIIPGRKA